MTQPKIGEVRIREFIHPDSIAVTVWVVEQYSLASGKYAKPGQAYWKRIGPIEPFTSKMDAVTFFASVAGASS
ncbi:MAG: hypothetical protein GY753_09870 [Gammaproteobacteria bacterium]|nr:hypothetical protein [Gammaproteobacteria bacterium]